MDCFESALQLKCDHYRKLIHQAEMAMQSLPEGNLRISPHRGKTQYYMRIPADFENKHYNGKYIRSSNVSLISALCSRRYWEAVKESAGRQLDLLKNYITAYEPLAIQEAYSQLPEEIAKYVQPVDLPDEEYAARWEAEAYEKKPFAEGAVEIYSARGERVRSKSEKIIADTLARLGIPYKYEKPLRLTSGKIIHPDFCLLSISKRCEYLLEHFGKMDDPDYVENALKRLDDYGRSSIWQGNQLIVSYETKNRPLNTKQFEKMILQFVR